jgi:hypothetical protein
MASSTRRIAEAAMKSSCDICAHTEAPLVTKKWFGKPLGSSAELSTK